MNLAHEIERALRKERMVRSGSIVVCAVSGGPDSMVLLHVMDTLKEKLQLTIVAAHVNHGFRGVESDREEELVSTYAQRLGCPFESIKLDVPKLAEQKRMNAQVAAREERYRFLLATADQYGADAIATGHHLNDQAETILMNLFSGASLQGLSGMAPVRTEKNVQLIRPLLRISKHDILTYADHNGVPFLEDSSNQTRKYERNRLRLDVMPLLTEQYPALSLALSRTADVLRDEDSYLEERTVQLADILLVREDGNIRASRSELCREPVALQRRLIKLILNYLSQDSRFPNFTRIELIRAAIIDSEPPSLSLDVGEGIRFERVYDRLTWRLVRPGQDQNRADNEQSYAYTLEQGAHRMELPEAGGWIEIEYGAYDSGVLLTNSAYEAVFDKDQLPFPLTVRSRRDGDRIAIHGSAGTRKVKDLLIDLKLDPEERSKLPLVIDGDGRLVWIPGIRRSTHALVSTATEQTVRLRYVQGTLH